MRPPLRPTAKLYGERNTGTNHLTGLIGRHLDLDLLPGVHRRGESRAVGPGEASELAGRLQMPESEVRADLYFRETFHVNLGWKHSLVRTVECLQSCAVCSGNLSFLTLTKNPYAWLLSLHRRPYHHHGRELPDLRTFLTTPWRTVGRENAPREFSSPVEMWNAKNASYLHLARGFPVLHLRYEDVLADPNAALDAIQEICACPRKQDDADRDTAEDEEGAFYRAYYLGEQWRQHLSSYEIGLINERLDDDVLARFRYEKLS